MFVHKISPTINFGSMSILKSVNSSTRSMTDNQNVDSLVKKMNALQLDVEKMRARQMLSDRIVTTGKLNLINKDYPNCKSLEYLDKIC